MKFKLSNLFFILGVVVFLSFASFQAKAENISSQTELLSAISLTVPVVGLDFLTSTLSLNSSWNPNVNSTIHTFNITTPSGGIIISGNNRRFLNFSVTSPIFISLDADSELTINSFSNTSSGSTSNVTYSTRGGAIYVGGNLSLTEGTYTFTNNTVSTSNNASGAAVDNLAYAYGGAIYAEGDLNLSKGTYTFTNNTVSGAYPPNVYGAGRGYGLGGAIYVGGNLSLTEGTYTFTNNTALSISYNRTGYAHGGAIYIEGDLSFSKGTYTFENNTASATSYGSGLGGAIYAASGSTLTFEKGIYTFNENIASGAGSDGAYGGVMYVDINSTLTFSEGTYTFTKNAVISNGYGGYGGYGGVIYVIWGELLFTRGVYVFESNAVSGRLSYGGVIYAIGSNITFDRGTYIFTKNTSSGTDTHSHGGAICTGSFNITFNRGTYTFTENAASMVSYSYGTAEAAGGAIYAEGGGSLFTFEKGTYTFTGNSVTVEGAGNAYGGAICTAMNLIFKEGKYTFIGNTATAEGAGSLYGGMGAGGAIYFRFSSSNPYSQILTFADGTYTFINNTASGEVSGRGGAIYIQRDLSILGGDFTFLNNSASHFGGAIFVAGNPSVPLTVEIIAKEGHSIIFKGNKQGDERNSIYFGSQGIIDVTFTVEEGASFVMLDPLHSASTTILTITKDGEGVWKLGGQSILAGKDKVVIKEGILRLLASNKEELTTRIDLTSGTSVFELSSSGEIQVVANKYPVYVTANRITVAGAMSVYSDPRYSITGDAMDGNKIVLMHMYSGSGNPISDLGVNETYPPNPNHIPSVITIGAYDYVLEKNPLRWEIDEDDSSHGTLSLYFNKRVANRSINGSDSLKVPGVEMLSNPTTLNIINYGLSALDDYDKRKNDLWFETTLILTKIDTVDLVGGNVSIGYDRKFFENVIIGVSYSQTVVTYKEEVAYGNDYLVKINASSINPTFVLYSAAKLFSVVNMAAQISYGVNVIDQYRDIYVEDEQEILYSLYYSHMLKAAVSVDIPINLGKVALKPTAGYEFMYLFVKAHPEESVYKENEYVNSLALIYGDLKHIIHQVTVGVKGSYIFDRVTMEGKIMFLGLFGDLYAKTSNRFAEDEDPTSKFDAEGRVGYAYNLNFGLTAKIDLTDRVDVLFGYNGIINAGGYTHTLKLNLSYGF